MKISVVQVQSQTDKNKNLQDVLSLAEDAIKQSNPDLIAFPEMFLFNGGTDQDKKKSAENIPDGDTTQILSKFAKQNNVFIHGGSIYERSDDKISNTSVIIDNNGSFITKYRKIHLFDVTIPNGTSYRESDSIKPGKDIVTYDALDFKIGCTICYDLRFAELFLMLAKKLVDIIVVPASFTYQTGKDHWETLLKARAIETQAYIVAPAQYGEFPNESGNYNKTWGHSMIIDPWGDIIQTIPIGSGWATAEISRERINQIRKNIPLSEHRIL